MKVKNSVLKFFMGTNSPQGFISHFAQLANVEENKRVFILKGGPGCGKSTAMKKVYEHFSNKYDDLELVYCASDPQSLDAVIIPALNVSVMDGTLPHALEPRYPGIVETIFDFANCWDSKKLLPNKDKIIKLTKANSAKHEHARRFLNAASILSGDTYRLACECINAEKLNAYAKRLSDRELKTLKTKGKEEIKLITAITNKGVYSFTDTVKNMCNKIYVINDDYGAVSRILLHKMRSYALEKGYSIITSYCPLSPYDKIEHMVIKEAKIGFITSNREHDFSLMVDSYRNINCKRFMNMDELKQHKRRIAFNFKSEQKMISQVTQLLSEAKDIHDELEKYYTQAVDFSLSDMLCEDLIENIELLQEK